MFSSCVPSPTHNKGARLMLHRVLLQLRQERQPVAARPGHLRPHGRHIHRGLHTQVLLPMAVSRAHAQHHLRLRLLRGHGGLARIRLLILVGQEEKLLHVDGEISARLVGLDCALFYLYLLKFGITNSNQSWETIDNIISSILYQMQF